MCSYERSLKKLALQTSRSVSEPKITKIFLKSQGILFIFLRFVFFNLPYDFLVFQVSLQHLAKPQAKVIYYPLK